MFAPVLKQSLFFMFLSLVPGTPIHGVEADESAAGVQGNGRPLASLVALPAFGHPAKPPGELPLLLGAALPAPARRRLRVVVYARYSTVEQNPLSIDDQVAMCRRFIDTLGLGDVEIIEVHDAAVSGEHTHRPGIDRVWELIETEGCDVIVAEDMSRFYRHSTRAMQFIETAVDAGIRVIAINNHLDTAEEEGRWRMGGHIAAIKGEMDNSETRQRIMRALEARWRGGYAVGSIKPGYTRVPTTPATDREPARGPFRDKKDPKCTPVIRRAYEMCAAEDATWVVARYLTDSDFPKSARARLPEWTEDNVNHFIRDPAYRGEEFYRVRHNEKKYRLGKSVQVLTPPDQILHRDTPHLAHVPRWLWETANRVLDQRNINTRPKSGKEHPLHGVPHDSRGSHFQTDTEQHSQPVQGDTRVDAT